MLEQATGFELLVSPHSGDIGDDFLVESGARREQFYTVQGPDGKRQRYIERLDVSGD
jgi:hypothetical protein